MIFGVQVDCICVPGSQKNYSNRTNCFRVTAADVKTTLNRRKFPADLTWFIRFDDFCCEDSIHILAHVTHVTHLTRVIHVMHVKHGSRDLYVKYFTAKIIQIGRTV